MSPVPASSGTLAVESPADDPAAASTDDPVVAAVTPAVEGAGSTSSYDSTGDLTVTVTSTETDCITVTAGTEGATAVPDAAAASTSAPFPFGNSTNIASTEAASASFVSSSTTLLHKAFVIKLT
jgi:hypothetical protein